MITAVPTGTARYAASRPIAAWLPAIFGMLVICCESTRLMGADHTMVWLSRLCSPIMNLAVSDVTELNHVLRKSGHFIGYGLLGLVYVHGWLSLLVTKLNLTWTKLRVLSGGFGVFCVALVASMDEFHQSFLPNRTARVADVLLDTAGALLFIFVVSLVIMLRRKRTLARLLLLRTARRSQNAAYSFQNDLLEHSL